MALERGLHGGGDALEDIWIPDQTVHLHSLIWDPYVLLGAQSYLSSKCPYIEFVLGLDLLRLIYMSILQIMKTAISFCLV